MPGARCSSRMRRARRAGAHRADSCASLAAGSPRRRRPRSRRREAVGSARVVGTRPAHSPRSSCFARRDPSRSRPRCSGRAPRAICSRSIASRSAARRAIEHASVVGRRARTPRRRRSRGCRVPRDDGGVAHGSARPRATSRKPWLLAGGAAAAVLAAGLLWPTGAGGPATADVPEPATAQRDVAPTAAAARRDTGSDRGGRRSAAPTDLVAVDERTARRSHACAGDSSLPRRGRARSGDSVRSRRHRSRRGSARRRRCSTTSAEWPCFAWTRSTAHHPSQLVVVMLDDDRWLLRDVHVAKQP